MLDYSLIFTALVLAKRVYTPVFTIAENLFLG